jgi:hypothetical protein
VFEKKNRNVIYRFCVNDRNNHVLIAWYSDASHIIILGVATLDRLNKKNDNNHICSLYCYRTLMQCRHTHFVQANQRCFEFIYLCYAHIGMTYSYFITSSFWLSKFHYHENVLVQNSLVRDCSVLYILGLLVKMSPVW